MAIKKNKRPSLTIHVNDWLIDGSGNHGLTRLWKPPRRKKIVKPLNPSNAGVSNSTCLKLPQPLETELRSASDIGTREIAFAQELNSSIQERLCHKPSIGKVLPNSQIVIESASETHYRELSVIFSRMIRETTDDVLEAVAANTSTLMKKLGLSDAKVAEAAGSEVSAKSVNNAANGRHSVKVSTIAAVAHGIGLEAWQLLVPDLPLDNATQRSLALVVKAFVKLEHTSRERIRSAAENEASGAGLFNEIFGAPHRRAAKAR